MFLKINAQSYCYKKISLNCMIFDQKNCFLKSSFQIAVSLSFRICWCHHFLFLSIFISFLPEIFQSHLYIWNLHQLQRELWLFELIVFNVLLTIKIYIMSAPQTEQQKLLIRQKDYEL